MVRESDQRSRWCAEFAAILIEETKVNACDALFLAEQARTCFPGLPPSYAVRMALTNSQHPAKRVVAGRWWDAPAKPRPTPIDDSAVGW
jgi:hypothetical protein